MSFFYPFFVFFIALTFFHTSAFGAEVKTPNSASQVEVSTSRPATLIVQPVILRDDDGSHAARHALPQNLINQAYSHAHLRLLYLTPIYWNNSKARQGKINLNAIVTQGRQKKIIARDPSILTLLFVSSVDGLQGPLGRGLQNGNVCFVCLGPEGAMNAPAKQAFVVAHEIGHCLGLKHVVDDPSVPNDIPNLEGDGPFEKRIAPDGLHPTQIATIQTSPLYHPAFHFLSPAQATQQIINESWGNNPLLLHDNELRFQLGLPLDASIPSFSLPPQKNNRKFWIQQQFSQVSLPFTKQETQIIKQRVNQLEKLLNTSTLLGGKNNLISQLPWNFIKVKSNFCMGFSHTRGLNILLTAYRIKQFKKNPTMAMTLLLHEKTHIAQRLSPSIFKSAYQRYGFIPSQLAPGERNRLQILSNPDASPPAWALTLNHTQYLIATSLTVKKKKFLFKELCYPLSKTPKGYIAQAPQTKCPKSISLWKKKFSIQTGFDDPREIQAYLISSLFKIDLLKLPLDSLTPEQKKTLNDERSHLPELFTPKKLTPHL